MRLLIIGAGRTGKNLANKLCNMGHDVIMIDNNANALTNIDSEVDVLLVEGNGSTPDILEKAEVAKSDVVVAVTSKDEVNLLACHYARCAGVCRTIARISDVSYINSPLVDLGKFGVDRAVNHNEECAQEILNVLCLPGTIEVTNLLGGRISAIGFKLPSASPMLGKPLKQFKEDERFLNVRFIGLVHDDELEIPRGKTCFSEGDDVYVVLTPAETASFLDWVMGEQRQNLRKVIIAGSSDLGLSLAKLLEETPIKTVLIENNRIQAEYASELLNKCLVINADASKSVIFKEIGTDIETAFVAVTGDEEMNIVSCIQAKQLGAGFTVARIDKPEYIPIIDKLNLIDCIINPYLALIKTILQFVHGENIVDVGLFHRISGELLEIAIKAGSKKVNMPLSETNLPRGMIVAAVQRGNEAFIPTGEFVLKENDRLAVYCLPNMVNKLKSVFK